MMAKDDLVYVIPAGQYGKEGVLALLEQHPEIKFVSLVGIDLAGNDTDEKIPISVFFDEYDKFFNATAFQTDGSSVVLPGIATLSNARVDIKADPGVDWFVDYNKPSARLVDLLHLVPERTDTYIELLEFVEAAPRPYGQIEELLLGRPALQTVIDGRVETMQPSVFVDKLERAGALVWKEGWTLTEEGREFLEDLKVNGQA